MVQVVKRSFVRSFRLLAGVFSSKTHGQVAEAIPGKVSAGPMSGFWSTETMKTRLPSLVSPYAESQIANCSYEMVIGPQVFITGSGSHVRRELGPTDQISIPPGQFAQLLTEERIEVPPDSLGLISMKSGLKLRGLVNVSGFHVDPGFKGRLLFSVYNAGPQPLVLTRGQSAFLIWFATLDRTTQDVYDGKRSELEEISADDVMRLQGDVYSPQALAERVAATREDLGGQLSATESGLRSVLREADASMDLRVKNLERRLSLRWNFAAALAAAAAGAVLTLVIGGWIANSDDPTKQDPAQVEVSTTVDEASTTDG